MKGFYLLFFCAIAFFTSKAQAPLDSATLQSRYEQALERINSYQFDRALELLSACYIQDQQNKEYLIRMAYCHFQLGRYPDAKLFYNAVLKQDSLHTQAISSLGSIFERENNHREALRYYIYWASIDSTNSFAFKRSGYTAIRSGLGTEGILYFLKAHELNPADIETIDQLSSLYILSEQLDYAESVLRSGLNIDPNNIRLLQNKARLFNKKRDYLTVIQAIEKTMEQGDTSEYYQMMVAVAYLQMDSLDKAITNLEHIVTREEDTEHTHQYLGLAYRKKGDAEKSIAHFEKAIEKGISGKVHSYYGDLGAIYEEKGDYRKAITHYQKAYEYEPQAEYVFFQARNNDLAYRDKRIALKQYEQYLATKDPKFKEYAEQRIQQIKELIHFNQK
ncbi:MAG: tetratricopeptide repeat protein [Saprospiraceae bacterium]|nr:tetratricopeptide repeat protein [Saprospiraceae bacterium]